MAFTAYERRFVAQTPRARIAPPSPRAFDGAQALRTFDRVTKRAYVTPDWADAEIPPVVGRDEATFWLYAISGIGAARLELLALRSSAQRHSVVNHDEARAHARAELERLDVAQPPSGAATARRLAALAGPMWGPGSYREVAVPLAALLDLPALLETILDDANADAAAALAADAARRAAAFEANRGVITFALSVVTGDAPEVVEPVRAEPVAEPVAAAPGTAFAALRELGRGDGVAERAWLTHSLAAGFAYGVAPFLDDTSFEHARAVVHAAVRRALARPPFSGEGFQGTFAFPAACYLAASLHLTDDVEAIVAWWSGDVATAKLLSFLPAIVYGLRTPDAVVAESRRLGLALAEPRAVRDWLATTGEAGLDYAYEQLAEHASEATADALVDAVAALDTPSLPATMLRLTTIPVLYVPARAWLEANFDRALAALASAHDGTAAPSETANEILRRFARREHAGAVAALARRQRAS